MAHDNFMSPSAGGITHIQHRQFVHNFGKLWYYTCNFTGDTPGCNP